MKWERIPLGPLQTNCYVLHHEGEAIVVDPGGGAPQLESWLEQQKVKPAAILLTHAHFDHIGAVDHIRKTYNIEVYLHEAEEDWLMDPHKNGSGSFLGANSITAKPAEHLLKEEGKLSIGSFTFDVLETPGHSPGSVSFYHEASSTVFSGDALFYGSIGRTDLLGGNHEQLLTSIHDKLLTLPEETTVACGHGPVTNIRHEMDTNPFLNGF